ncbi:MAG: hemolysin family protein [Gammaproteobacteria bacterium]|nr:hemolysin family protein [Gammaproteobacteria bacterium]NNL51448.1 HlyC/CorC family transporter [Woeseiaceae bacterium]
MLLLVTAVGVVLVVSFLCSVFESVLLSVTRPQIEILARDGRRSGLLLASFKENMDVPIAAILILNTAAHTIGAAVAGASYANVFSANTLWLFSILFTIAVLLFTEIIPKTLGVSHAQALAPLVAHGIRWLTVLLRPLVSVSERISRSLRSDTDVPVTSAEEIRLLASLGRSEGVVGTRTAGMIVGATHLSYLRAHDVMLPRDDVQFLAGTMTRDEALALARKSGHSRFPFSPTGEINDVTGVILVKELFFRLLSHDDAVVDWESLRQDALIVPESLPLPRLLRSFQDSQRHLAIVIDEYGDVEGIATLEDVLEEIVGEIYDESDRPANDIVEREDGALQVQAAVDLRKLSAALAISWEPEGDASTVGGLVTETLERIPSVGDSIIWHGYRITVLRAGRNRVKLLSVKKT